MDILCYGLIFMSLTGFFYQLECGFLNAKL